MIHKTPFRSRFGFCFRFRSRSCYLALLILSLPVFAPALETCPTYTCPSPATASPPLIHFPFLVPGRNISGRCGYPGFHLTCNTNDNHRTTLTLPLSGNFSVESIDYSGQMILLSDPHNCLPRRLLTLDLSRTPFFGAESRNHTFLNCTDTYNSSLSSSAVMAAPSPCLSSSNHTVYLTFMEATVEELVGTGACRVIKSVWTPSLWPVNDEDVMSRPDLDRARMALAWDTPDCSVCERRDGSCGFRGRSGLAVNCSVSVSDPDDDITNGAAKIIKYGLILGLGIPGFVLIVGLIFYFGGRVRSYNQHHRQANTEFSPSVFPQPAVIMVGLDGQTIESYPKTLLGESGRLPNPSDALCAICLSDYQAKETLRTIPECNHYFHAQCIDEWLTLKGTCPLCRNSPAK